MRTVCICYRHVGDLGNVVANNGEVKMTITDRLVSLFGPLSVIGKSIVVSKTRGQSNLTKGRIVAPKIRAPL